MGRYCPLGIARFVPGIKFRNKIKFLLQNILCYFSVGMELENEKTESVNENENKENKNIIFAYNWLPFQCSKIYKYEDHFFSVLYAI